LAINYEERFKFATERNIEIKKALNDEQKKSLDRHAKIIQLEDKLRTAYAELNDLPMKNPVTKKFMKREKLYTYEG